MHSDQWLSTEELSAACGISVQAARSAVRSALNGRKWRGHQLKARRVLGRGGRSGVTYEVALASLPAGMIILPLDPGEPIRQAACQQSATVLRRLEIITPILSVPADCRGRSHAVSEAARKSGTSSRTLYRWLAQYERHGVRGLARSRPAGAGERRVQVSRVFDRAWRARGGCEIELASVASELGKALRGLWASRAEHAGGAEIRRLAEFLLQEMCEARDMRLPVDAFQISRRTVDAFARYRVVNQRRNDRKAFDDAKPRIRRDWTDLEPMERVVGDVKHLDVVVTRPDGTTAWPKIVAFMDAATGRVFVHPLLLLRGEGVRQEHVIEAFLAMVSDPAWGFPAGLYLDNGSEFGALAKMDAALQLMNEPGARTIIYAKPYNASAKPIESLFARLDRYVFSLLPGYAGPNRMSKKTQTVGRPPKPYSGEWDQFCATLQDLITAHNHRPVGGVWSGRSPEEWFQGKVQTGWRPSGVDPAELDAAFSDSDSRRVDRGVLRIGGRRYTHPGLSALPSRTVVDLALPWRRAVPPLAKLAGTWVYLAPEVAYPARWIEGAREATRRQALQSAHVSRLAREAPSIDPVAAKIRWAKRQAKTDSLPPLQTLDLGSKASDRAKSIRQGKEVSPDPSPAELRRQREMALTERLERQHGRNR